MPHHLFTCLTDHAIVQICIIFCLLHRNDFFAYVQHFNHTLPALLCSTTDGAAGLHILKWVVRNNGVWVGNIIPLHHLCSPTHVIPHFRKEVNLHLTHHTAYKFSNEFWLNKYWNNEFFYALSLS